jgi:hypothetical protein
MLFFKWIRDSVRNAVLGGVQDALEHMNLVAAKYEREMVHTAIDQEAVAVVKTFDKWAEVDKQPGPERATEAPRRAKK